MIHDSHAMWREEIMKSTKIALALIMLVAAFITVAHGQTTIFVPGNVGGYFGNPADEINPLVPAITVSGPATITVTYVSGTVTDCCGVNTGPDGAEWNVGSGSQAPLQQAKGISGGWINNLDALIGAFVPTARASAPGFTAIDGTKGATRVGILPDRLFFIGTGKTFSVNQAGTLFLGINDCWVSDNGGGFYVTVSAQ